VEDGFSLPPSLAETFPTDLAVTANPVQAEGHKGVRVDIVDKGDGSYVCTYVPRVAGTCRICISLGGVGVAASPYTVHVAAGAVATFVAEGASLRKAYKDEPLDFSPTALDAIGNVVPLQPEEICVKIRPPLNAPTAPAVELLPFGDGRLACSFVPTRVGRHVICMSQVGSQSRPVECVCAVSLRPKAGAELAAAESNGESDEDMW